MTLKHRFSLIGAGLILFSLLGPFLILTALGYKLDTQNFKFLKTGSMVIKTEPKGAYINLNGDKTKHTSNATIRFLLPKDYQVMVWKEGYKPWSKRLAVESQLVTWGNLNRTFISLFLEDPKPVKEIKAQAVFNHPSKQSLYYIDENGAGHFVDLKDGKSSNLGLNALWEIVRPYASFLGPSSVYHLIHSKNIELDDSFLELLKKFETNDRYAAYLIGGNLTAVNMSGVKIFAKEDVSAFALEGHDLWFAQGKYLSRYNLESRETSVISDHLVRGNSTEIIRSNGQAFVITDHVLYKLSDSMERIYEPVTYAYWDNRASRLVYSNDNEVFLYDPGTLRSNLILRTSSLISNPVFNAETGFLFYQHEGKIKASELDERDHRNTYEFTESFLGFSLSDKGNYLYVLRPDGILMLEIR
jgi:hypothetical protein